MAGTTLMSILSQCHISVSQEEVLANLRGGWERNGHYSLDETPSQNIGFHLPNPPVLYEGDDGSESSESDGDLGFTQEPVEFFSPSSSPQQANVGGEGNDDGVAKEDSYVAAFESDRSQSPSQDWQGQIEQPDPEANLGMSADFLTQPAVGVMDFQFTASEDVEQQILRRETIPEAEFQILPRCNLPLLLPIPENAVIEAPDLLAESCMQPFTQPAVETQPFESLSQIQEPVQHVQLAEGRNEIIDNPATVDMERVDTEEPHLIQQGRGRDDAPDVNNASIELTGEQMSQERGEDELLPNDSPLPIDDSRDSRSIEHEQQPEHQSSRDIPLVEVHSGSLLSEKAQPLVDFGTERTPLNSEQMPRSNGDTNSLSESSKRVHNAEEPNGHQKRQRVEASPVRNRSFPKTVMDVVRSRSRSLSNSLVDDECNILSIVMRAGVSFPPFVYDKRSV